MLDMLVLSAKFKTDSLNQSLTTRWMSAVASYGPVAVHIRT
jgi:hypothetical protein